MAWLFENTARRLFHDRVWKRDEMPAWDRLWAKLSVEARKAFFGLHVPSWPGEAMPVVTAADIAARPREELLRSGFLETTAPGKIRLFPAVWGFATRTHMLRRWQLLKPSAGALSQYVQYAFTVYELEPVLEKVIDKQIGRVSSTHYLDDRLQDFVSRHFWPDWVSDYLNKNKPLVGRVVQAVAEAGGRTSLENLSGLLPNDPPDAVRQAADALVNHLALFEDVHPETYELLIGFLPQVLAGRQHAAHPVPVPELTPRPTPAAVSPAEGVRLLDMRALLLELTGNRARVKQNGDLYAKEQDRLLAVLTELPGWMADDWTGPAERLLDILYWMRSHQFLIRVEEDDKNFVVQPGPGGRKWLAASMSEQYEQLFASHATPNRDRYDDYYPTDRDFLNSDVVAVAASPRGAKKGSRASQATRLEAADRQALREAVYRALAALPRDQFVRQDDFIEMAARGPLNPVLLGQTEVNGVIVRRGQRTVAPLRELYDDAARQLLREVLAHLVQLGGVQIGNAADGKRLVCRQVWLDVYFGKAKAPKTIEQPVEARTIVQPDFSVMVLGLNPAAATDLAMISDRATGQMGQGALTFKISRESIWRAVTAGLTEAAVINRLAKHASTPLPPNVVTQIRTWAGQVRHVTLASGQLIRCPDIDTAERVRALLGKNAERVGETAVFWSGEGTMRPATRQKLREQGVILDEVKKPVKRRGSS